ncbi:MAG: monofunctional biosynthetic peptidoglycan transglycosylase [Candidatus Aminicenantales bacterium]
MRKRRVVLKIFLTLAAVAAVFIAVIVLTLPNVSDLKTKNPETTSLIRLRLAAAGAKKSVASVRLRWISSSQIPALMKRCVLVSEDAAFYDHKGIDFEELKNSIKQDLREKRFSRGGSTITQQLAKNLYLSTSKSFVRKIREVLIARRLEKTLSKDRILQLYLNVIEWGPGVYGLPAAARRWFDKDAADLTLEEMVRLTAIIPRPLRSDPRKNDGWMRFKGRWIADTLQTVGAIGDDDHDALLRAFQE